MEIVAQIIAGLIVVVLGHYIIKWLKGRRQPDSAIEAPPTFEQHIHVYRESGNGKEGPSPLGRSVLVAMSKTERPAIISSHATMPSHLHIDKKEFIDANDDQYRLDFLEAIDELIEDEYIEEKGEGVFRLTANGLRTARKLDRSLDSEDKTLGEMPEDQISESDMKDYLDSIGMIDVGNFYRGVKEPSGVLDRREERRPSLTKEILDWHKSDPALWAKACRLLVKITESQDG